MCKYINTNYILTCLINLQGYFNMTTPDMSTINNIDIDALQKDVRLYYPNSVFGLFGSKINIINLCITTNLIKAHLYYLKLKLKNKNSCNAHVDYYNKNVPPSIIPVNNETMLEYYFHNAYISIDTIYESIRYELVREFNIYIPNTERERFRLEEIFKPQIKILISTYLLDSLCTNAIEE